MNNHKDQTDTETFPLMEKAEKAGLFSSENGFLISAPTATGKTYIGLEVIRRSLPKKPAGELFLYLVPYKALADEVFDKLKNIIIDATINIKTGDYDTPFDIQKTDVLVATYESAEAMFSSDSKVWPSLVIADEVSIVGENNRGPKIEGLLSYMANRENLRLITLSAVLKDPNEIAKWLKLIPIVGDDTDRKSKLTINLIETWDGKKEISKLVQKSLKLGNILVFCSKVKKTKQLCDELMTIVSEALKKEEREQLKKISQEFSSKYKYLVEMPSYIEHGVAYHNANLIPDAKRDIVQFFNKRQIKLITATTTLSAGVNLPARTVILSDATRFIPENRTTEPLPICETINMVGRAGRPNIDLEGTAYILIPKGPSKYNELKKYSEAVKKCKLEKLESQIPTSDTNVMFFILSTVLRTGSIERDDLINEFNKTLWSHQTRKLSPPLPTGKEVINQIAESITINRDTNIKEKSIKIENGMIRALGGSEDYKITLSANGGTCTCLSYTYRSENSCKHITKLQYIIIKRRADPEATSIAIQSLRYTSAKTDPLSLLSEGVEVLIGYGFLMEDEQGKLEITLDGKQALMSFLLSMHHVRIIRDRIRKSPSVRNEMEVIQWAIDDFHPLNDSSVEEMVDSLMDPELKNAIIKYVEGRKKKEVVKEEKMRDLLNALDILDQIFSAYHAFAQGNERLQRIIRDAKRRVNYGSPKELLPLVVLNFDEIDEDDKTSCARKFYDAGKLDLWKLATCSVEDVSKIISLSNEDAEKIVKKSKAIVELIDEFRSSQKKESIGMLSMKTEIQPEDLQDYIIPT